MGLLHTMTIALLPVFGVVYSSIWQQHLAPTRPDERQTATDPTG